ncbi:UDP-N-acetyl-D-glucosamine 6-dehydrogenase [Fundidesulfovibrio magnetotacticus]|uniref:UDP-N-acetyl-D-glucosamine 6-dehydrogenase n=1 Tax=Fundidesulfovibrio magnetotacticus TaxID=2730080 RepID=A0A6V8LPX0_9BACT|nr:nucleotide sugar dehydrogenase [Fundidesulfovibrio magnetotacticus]GFK92388.1 UDP-N-acetyl-D-glucosamine 6-dehydrogenase [Fundidesulfovibrio magnetotacticus]
METALVTFEQLKSGESRIAVVGLGYVGLPLAVALAGHFKVTGFDISPRRVERLKSGVDDTGEVSAASLASADVLYSHDPECLKGCGVVIVAVPTPIDSHRRPDLAPVRGASITVGRQLSPGSVVVFESTVYPGLTEEICVPLLEENSGLACGRDFFVGYSPERINPGDKVNTLETIVKVVAGQTDEVRELLCRLYGSVVRAGVHPASSIKVAEAAKVIENTQRDLNIALMNELALICEKVGIDTQEVLEAAGSKWNFLPFRPGLVGGHCIGVDPYYLTFLAEGLGLHPQVILAGRRINDSMGKHVAEVCIKRLIAAKRPICGSTVGVWGLTFKENVPDLRNTKVVDVIRELGEYGVNVLVHDPMAAPEEAMHEYGLTLSPMEDFKGLEALIVAVGHHAYKTMDPARIAGCFTVPEAGLVMDIRGALDRQRVLDAGLTYWRL